MKMYTKVIGIRNKSYRAPENSIETQEVIGIMN